MRVNVSQLQLFMQCQRKWHYLYVDKRGVAQRSQALDDGLAWHDLMESNPSSDLPIREDDSLWMKGGYDHWLKWKADNPTIEHLARELTLEAPLGHMHTLFGRLDALVRWNNQLWHLQHKTVAPNKSLHVYTRVIARSWHEHAYKHMVEYVYNEPLAGTILVMCRKLADRTMEDYTKKGLSNLVIEFLPHPDHSRIMLDIEAAATEMQCCITVPILPIGNSEMCGGFYHNSPCPYLDVCDGLAPLDSLEKVDPLERYKPCSV